MPIKQKEDVPEAVLYNHKDLHAVVRLMITASGFEFDQVGTALGYSASHWSEILNGKKNLPWSKLEAAMDFCESDIPLFWLAHRRGYERPRPRQTKLEKENEELKSLLEAQQKILKGLFRDQP